MDVKEEITRREVVQAASRLFQRYGLVKTTMEDIARETGRGKSTLYYYFKSKDEIFDAVVNQELIGSGAIETASPLPCARIDRAFINTPPKPCGAKPICTHRQGNTGKNPRLLEALKSTSTSGEGTSLILHQLGWSVANSSKALLREAGCSPFCWSAP
jgi:AcrR family transcriptional regulator